MANNKTGAERYNDRMDKIWENAKENEKKYRPKIIESKVRAIIKYYGRIKIKTNIGVLEYSFKVGGDEDPSYQMESVLTNYHKLTSGQLDEIDNLIMEKLTK